MPVVDRGNAEIYYESQGDPQAPALIFAHGAGGNAASWWQQIPAFAHQYHVVSFDHRGFGRSRCDATDFHVRHFEGDLAAVMDAAGIAQAVVVCQSMGGWSGTRLAAAYPQRVRGLMLCNTPGAIPTPELQAAMRQTATLLRGQSLVGAAISEAFARRNPEGAFLYGQLSALNPPRPDLSSLSRDGMLSSAQVQALCSTRIHFLSSDLDPLFPPAVLQATAKCVNGSIEFVQGAGHSTYFEMPATFNRSLRTFLNSL